MSAMTEFQYTALKTASLDPHGQLPADVPHRSLKAMGSWVKLSTRGDVITAVGRAALAAEETRRREKGLPVSVRVSQELRLDSELWAAFSARAESNGSDWYAVLHQFIQDYAQGDEAS